jgi:hypothetical protein
MEGRGMRVAGGERERQGNGGQRNGIIGQTSSGVQEWVEAVKAMLELSGVAELAGVADGGGDNRTGLFVMSVPEVGLGLGWWGRPLRGGLL